MIGDQYVSVVKKIGALWLCRLPEEGVSCWSVSKYGAIRGAVKRAQVREYRRNLRRIRRG